MSIADFQKRVFIFGAGASRNSGAPLMTDFLDKAEYLYRKFMTTGGYSPNHAKESFEIVLDALNSMQSLHSKSNIDLDNIEDVFGAFEIGKLIKKLGSFPQDRIDDLYFATSFLIAHTLEHSCIYEVGGDGFMPAGDYRKFIDKLMENSKSEKDGTSLFRNNIFITFNYDVCLDAAIHYHQIDIDYDFFAGNILVPEAQYNAEENEAAELTIQLWDRMSAAFLVQPTDHMILTMIQSLSDEYRRMVHPKEESHFEVPEFSEQDEDESFSILKTWLKIEESRLRGNYYDNLLDDLTLENKQATEQILRDIFYRFLYVVVHNEEKNFQEPSFVIDPVLGQVFIPKVCPDDLANDPNLSLNHQVEFNEAMEEAGFVGDFGDPVKFMKGFTRDQVVLMKRQINELIKKTAPDNIGNQIGTPAWTDYLLKKVALVRTAAPVKDFRKDFYFEDELAGIAVADEGHFDNLDLTLLVSGGDHQYTNRCVPANAVISDIELLKFYLDMGDQELIAIAIEQGHPPPDQNPLRNVKWTDLVRPA